MGVVPWVFLYVLSTGANERSTREAFAKRTTIVGARLAMPAGRFNQPASVKGRHVRSAASRHMNMKLEAVQPRWSSCIVAAPGPSLPVYVDEVCASGLPTIVVNDAWKLLPWADVLYACDNHWWEYHQGTAFAGEKWSTHEGVPRENHGNDKREIHRKWGVRCVAGCDDIGFSYVQDKIHYGSNSGFQAINLAILFGCTHIIMVGFDMRIVDQKSHFFGDHPQPIKMGGDYSGFVKYYDRAAKDLPVHIRIVNATEGSAVRCFPMMGLQDAIKDGLLYRNGSVAHAAAG